MSAGESVIGYESPQVYYCRTCAPASLQELGYTVTAEGTFAPDCETCGKPLTPCEHVWDEWKPAWRGADGTGPAEIRFCRQPDCGEADYR